MKETHFRQAEPLGPRFWSDIFPKLRRPPRPVQFKALGITPKKTPLQLLEEDLERRIFAHRPQNFAEFLAGVKDKLAKIKEKERGRVPHGRFTC